MRLSDQALLSRFDAPDDALALWHEGVQLSFAQLQAMAHRLAHGLMAQGLKAGDLFAFLLPNGPEILAAYIACARTGIIALPLSQRIGAAELQAQLAHAQAQAFWCHPSYAHLLGDTASGQAPGLRLLPLDFLQQCAHLPEHLGSVAVDPQSPFCIMFTGGTTGRLKAAMLTHQSWRCVFETSIGQWGIHRGDRHLIVLPMSHAAWYTAGVSLLAGAPVTVVPRWDPARVLDLIEAHRITTFNLIPTLLNELIQVQQQQPRDVSSLRLLTVAGSVLTEATYVQARDLFGEVIGNVYGLTELAGPVTFLLPHHMASGLHRSVGLPGQAIQMARLDAQGQPQLGPGQGELLLGGDQVTSGYWRDPQASAQAMLGPWFRTGDEVRIDEDGFVYIVDRIKDMIKTGGLNVFPSEVEEVLYTHPAVMEAAVFGLPDPRWSEAVHAAVVLKPGQAATAADLQAHCRQHLAAHKAPKQVHFLAQLPRTRFGKFDKTALRQQLAAAQ